MTALLPPCRGPRAFMPPSDCNHYDYLNRSAVVSQLSHRAIRCLALCTKYLTRTLSQRPLFCLLHNRNLRQGRPLHVSDPDFSDETDPPPGTSIQRFGEADSRGMGIRELCLPCARAPHGSAAPGLSSSGLIASIVDSLFRTNTPSLTTTVMLTLT